MFKKLLFVLFLSFWGLYVQASSCHELFWEVPYSRLARDFHQHIQRITLPDGLILPYVHLRPKVPRNRVPIVFVSGFSKNMRSWIPQMEFLSRNGYEVLVFDQANVGYNLLENGIIDVPLGQGLQKDADMLLTLLDHLGFERVRLVGHSRGGGVSSIAALTLAAQGRLSSITIASSYDHYIWQQDSGDSLFANYYDTLVNTQTLAALIQAPQVVGHVLGQLSEHQPDYEDIPGLDSSVWAQAQGYILKSTRPSSLSSEVSTTDRLRELLELRQNSGQRIDVQVLAVENDPKFAPPEVLRAMDLQGVHFTMLENPALNHYWVQDQPYFFLSQLRFIQRQGLQAPLGN